MTLAYALSKTGHPNCRRPDKVKYCYRMVYMLYYDMLNSLKKEYVSGGMWHFNQ